MLSTYHQPFITVRRLICRVRGHRWNNWWNVVSDEDPTEKVGEFRLCRRCMESDNR